MDNDFIMMKRVAKGSIKTNHVCSMYSIDSLRVSGQAKYGRQGDGNKTTTVLSTTRTRDNPATGNENEKLHGSQEESLPTQNIR